MRQFFDVWVQNSKEVVLAGLPVVRAATQLEVFLLSRVEVSAAIALQRSFAEDLRRSSGHRAILLLCEHPACITTGTDSPGSLADKDRVESELAGCLEYSVNRGGGRIKHGPGQLGIYPVVSLSQTELTPFGYRDGLEELITNVACEICVPESEAISGVGVRCKAGLVARTAIQIQNNITRFGMYLNVNQVYDLGTELRNSSLAAATMKPTAISEVKSNIIKHFEQWLGNPKLSLHTSHPLLKRTFQSVPKVNRGSQPEE